MLIYGQIKQVRDAVKEWKREKSGEGAGDGSIKIRCAVR